MALVKKIENVDFVFDAALEKSNTNVMDRWILASCQSLLEFVDQEMNAYRLYTVVPRLLELIDNTTNWYIRFNRRRLKGELGVEDTKHALNTLFEVLYTTCRGLAPFTPFITDNIYQRLQPYLPRDQLPEDARSVHFLPYPTVRKELYDPVIERKVKRMQKVVELGRLARERRGISVKTPLQSMVVIHTDSEFLEDVKGLEYEITTELNILDFVLTSDENKYNIQYSVAADWPVLGKKLKKDMVKVKKALPGVTSEQAKSYMETGKLEVGGIELVTGDLIVRREVQQSEENKNQEVVTDTEAIVILDAEINPGLAQQGVAREIINRVQRLRKKAGLVPTDDVGMEYRVLSDPESIGLEEIFDTQTSVIQKALRRPIDKHVVTEIEGKIPEGKQENVIVEEEQEVQKATFLLRFIKL